MAERTSGPAPSVPSVVVHRPPPWRRLIPDFQGKWENLAVVTEAAPDILSHNLETVRRLTKQVRVQAKYDRSLEVLMRSKRAGLRTKSGIMLGLGEEDHEVEESMDDLRSVGVDILTLGQYLQPTKAHLPVAEFIHPDRFARFKGQWAWPKGFRYRGERPSRAQQLPRREASVLRTQWRQPIRLRSLFQLARA